MLSQRYWRLLHAVSCAGVCVCMLRGIQASYTGSEGRAIVVGGGSGVEGGAARIPVSFLLAHMDS